MNELFDVYLIIWIILYTHNKWWRYKRITDYASKSQLFDSFTQCNL